ncbi:MAG: hypothetical protein ACRDDC_03945 [Tannerellaceae bacterium]
MRLNPLGPTMAPAMMSPKIDGMRNLLSTMGATRIINRIMRNFTTGFSIGNVMLNGENSSVCSSVSWII